MITQSGNNTKTDQVVALIGVMVLSVGLAATITGVAIVFFFTQ